MTTDNKKNKDEKIDLGQDAVDAVADFVTDPNQRNRVWQTIRWGVDAAKKLFTMGVYIATNVATAVNKSAPFVKAAVVGTWNFGAKITKNWRNNLKNNWSELDEFGNTRSCTPKTVKGWWQTANFPAAVGLSIAAAFAVAELPWVAVADYRDDPIYKMYKPQAKEVAGEKEWTVTCEYLEEESEADANCAYSIPDNSWLDLTYRITNPSFSSFFTGYSPRNHAAAPMLADDSQYCAINSLLEKPVFGAEKNLPPIYRAPVCDKDLDKLIEKLTSDIKNKEGEIVRPAGEVIEDDGRMWYRPADQGWWITGALASVWVGAVELTGDAKDAIFEWADEITTPDPEEETPAEGVEGEKTSAVDFNNATNGLISNDNQDVTLTASISFESGPKVKVA